MGSNPTLSAKIRKGLSSGPFLFWGRGVCGRTHWFDKNRSAIFGRRGPAAAVRSEAEDERPSPAASNPTLSATRWSDEDIAATLNRMALPTGQGKTWTVHRVNSLRRVRGIHAYKSAEKNGEWVTMREAAAKLAHITTDEGYVDLPTHKEPAGRAITSSPYQA